MQKERIPIFDVSPKVSTQIKNPDAWHLIFEKFAKAWGVKTGVVLTRYCELGIIIQEARHITTECMKELPANETADLEAYIKAYDELFLSKFTPAQVGINQLQVGQYNSVVEKYGEIHAQTQILPGAKYKTYRMPKELKKHLEKEASLLGYSFTVAAMAHVMTGMQAARYRHAKEPIEDTLTAGERVFLGVCRSRFVEFKIKGDDISTEFVEFTPRSKKKLMQSMQEIKIER